MLALNAPPRSETRLLICGPVEHGDQRGRTLGFPTANIAISERSIAPPDGVYAGFAYRADGSCHLAAVSVGRRPTFYADNGLHLVEAHLLDFDGDLYDEVVTVELVAKLRNQVRFSSAAELRRQLAVDCAECRRTLSDVRASGCTA